MISLDQALVELVCDGKADKAEALMRANNREFVRRKIEERENSGGVV
jgi:Tfp pilus assembly ATPase PilU